jgi:putative ABC transport system permease protein
MLYNNIKLALRNLAKHRFFTLLNVFGLALGMSSCLTVILIIRDQTSYDDFHPNQQRVFRINCQQADGARLASVPYPLGESLLKDFSICESSVRLVRSIQGTDATTAANLTLPVSGFYTEPSFFKVFGFQLESGDAATALLEPNSLVLSKEMAVRFFGDKNPIGETLNLKNKGTYRITGVVAMPPGKTHLDFDCLAAASTLTAIEAGMPLTGTDERVTDNWDNRYMTYVFVQLKPKMGKTDLGNALKLVAEKRLKLDKGDKDIQYFAQNLGNITPRPEHLANDIGGGAPWYFIWGMGAFVLILTIFPCLNYANLAVSRSLARLKEMGVRKVIGARPADVKRMILVESVLTALIALVLAWAMHLPLNQFVQAYFPPQAKLTGMHAHGWDWVIFIGFGLAVGLLSGWLPAKRLSKMGPALALRGHNQGEKTLKSRLGLRSAMLVGQFSLSMILLIVVSTLWSQMRYMTIADYGFDKENLLTVELQGNSAGTMAAELAKDPRVAGVCSSSVLLAGSNLEGITLQKERGVESLGVHCAAVDENYIPVMGLQLIAGENFPKTDPADSTDHFLVLNEQALVRFGLGTPAEAIGKTLWIDDETPITVRGVVKDFHYRIFEHNIEPFALRHAPRYSQMLHVRLLPGDPRVAMTALGSIWKNVDGVHPFKAVFMDESIQEAYRHVSFVGGLTSFFALLAMSLACMGLIGTVTYSVSTKVKEIGIRKVLGATTASVTLALSRRFLVMLGISVAIALPAGYLLSNLFLQLFVFRIAVGGLILGGSALALLALGLLAIGIQAGRAALANPVQSLRSE